MADKHTPGPWTLWTNVRGGFEVFADLDNGYKGAVVCQRANWDHRSAESIANARLIAAAPELLDALRAVIDGWRMGNDVVGPMRKATELLKRIEQETTQV